MIWIHVLQLKNFFLCEPRTEFRDFQEETCLTNILKGRDTSRVCHFSFRMNMRSQFERVGNQWIGSVQNESTAHAFCEGKETKGVVLKAGINVIPIEIGWRIIANGFSLPKFAVRGKTDRKVSVIFPPSVVPPHVHLKIEKMPKFDVPSVKGITVPAFGSCIET